MNKELILIIGGINSGKSSFALTIGERKTTTRAFIATAQPLDDEICQKIANHQRKRGDRWDTFEEPKDIVGLIESIMGKYDVILIDCLTLWISNLLTRFSINKGSIIDLIDKFILCLKKRTSRLIMVTNEVGMGIIPEYQLSRTFQYLLGKTNRLAAQNADTVYFMVSGIPVKIKPKD